jgi:hypothetical protein
MKNVGRTTYHEHNIMHCTLSSWLSGEHGDGNEEVTGRGKELIWLKQDIQTRSTKAKSPWTIDIHLIKKKK